MYRKSEYLSFCFYFCGTGTNGVSLIVVIGSNFLPSKLIFVYLKLQKTP